MKKTLYILTIVFLLFFITACGSNFINCQEETTMMLNEMTPERERTTNLIQEALQVTDQNAMMISRTFEFALIPEITSIDVINQAEEFREVHFVDVNGNVYRMFLENCDEEISLRGATRIDKRGRDGEFEVFWLLR